MHYQRLPALDNAVVEHVVPRCVRCPWKVHTPVGGVLHCDWRHEIVGPKHVLRVDPNRVPIIWKLPPQRPHCWHSEQRDVDSKLGNVRLECRTQAYVLGKQRLGGCTVAPHFVGSARAGETSVIARGYIRFLLAVIAGCARPAAVRPEYRREAAKLVPEEGA